MTLVARLKVTLSDVEPEVLRRFDVPLKIKLNRLHDVIQAAMGWTDTHLYEFRAGGVGWGVPRPEYDDDGPLPASKTSLLDLLEDVGTKTIHYIYDFGDNWHHVIKVEKIDDAIPGGEYPRLVRAIGACPPEDVGGGPGYADFLEVMADPNHEEHARMLKWHGGKFDPDEAEIGRILLPFLVKSAQRASSLGSTTLFTRAMNAGTSNRRCTEKQRVPRCKQRNIARSR